jgi:enoyl-CoA hydratase/carnithine racemase
METIQAIRQPVIASVQGPATAAGCQLVATCDLAVAAEDAWFATPGVKIGLFCSTPMVAVSRTIGRKLMMQMLLTGDALPAREALAAGLINQVVAAPDLEQAVRGLADKIAALSPAVIGIGKQAFYRQIELPLRDAYAYTAEVMTRNALMPAAHEGISAFLEKRTARWPS